MIWGEDCILFNLLIQGIKKQQVSESARDKLANVEAKATDLVENMRDIIWAMNSSNDNLPNLIAHLRLFVVEFFENNGLVCQPSIPEVIPDFVISGKKRRNIYLCVKEAAQNVIKHAKANQVDFDIVCQETLIISLKDNGIGINLTKQHRGFGLKSMSKRMKQIGATFHIKQLEGTQIILNIPLPNIHPIPLTDSPKTN